MCKFLIAGILAVSVLAAWTQAPPTGTVKGSVTLNGAPVPSGKVVLGSSGDSSYTAKANTDANGNFTVSNAPLGAIVVKAYDGQGHFLASGAGSLTQAGGVLSLTITATR